MCVCVWGGELLYLLHVEVELLGGDGQDRGDETAADVHRHDALLPALLADYAIAHQPLLDHLREQSTHTHIQAHTHTHTGTHRHKRTHICTQITTQIKTDAQNK